MGMEMGTPFMMNPFMQPPPFQQQYRPDYMGGYTGRPGRQFEMNGPPAQRGPGGFPFPGGQHRPYPRQGGPPMSQNRGQVKILSI